MLFRERRADLKPRNTRQFHRKEPFSPVIVPWGPACATSISYPPGIAEKMPENAAFIGSHGPITNWAFSPDLLGIGLPVGVARKMGETPVIHSW